METSTCRGGAGPQKLTKLDGNGTTILIPTSCVILPTTHTAKLSTCTSAHSHPLHNTFFTCMNMALQDNPYVPCSAAIHKILQHNSHTNMPTDSAMVMWSMGIVPSNVVGFWGLHPCFIQGFLWLVVTCYRILLIERRESHRAKEVVKPRRSCMGSPIGHILIVNTGISIS